MKFCKSLLTLGLLMATLATTAPAFAKDIDADLFKAISDGNKQQVESLLDHGANPFVTLGTIYDRSGNDPSVAATLQNLKGGLVLVMVTPLDYAFDMKEPEIAKLLANHMTRFTAPYKVGESRGTTYALRLAVGYDSVEIADILLRRGANMAEAEPLFDSVKSQAMADFLLSKGANVNARTPDGETALHLLSHYGFKNNEATVTFLISHGADVNARDAKGRTPLHVAVENGSAKDIQFLLEHGADASIRDKAGNTPIDLANSSEVAKNIGQDVRSEMVDTLMKHTLASKTAPAGLWCVTMSCPTCAQHGFASAGQQCFSTKASCESALASAKAAGQSTGATYSACTNEQYKNALQAACNGKDASRKNNRAAGSAYAACVQGKLAAAIAQLQGNPADDGKREEIIVLAGETPSVPLVPPEARTHLNRGVAAFGIAKSQADYQEAVKEFRQASNVAPWWADSYYNLGKAQEKAGDYPAAMKSYGLYVLAAPNAKDARETLELIDKLGYLADRTEKEHKALEEARSWARNKVYELQSTYGATVFKMSAEMSHAAAPNSKSGDWRWTLNFDSGREDRSAEGMHLRFSVEGDKQDHVAVVVPWNDVDDTGKFCLSRQDWDAGERAGHREYHIVACGAKPANKEGWIKFGTWGERNLPWIQVLYGCENGRCAGNRFILVK